MAILNTKDFIKQVLISEIDLLKNNHPYLAFMIIANGIEFLGKCLDSKLKDWNKSGRSRDDFELAIEEIPSLKKYMFLIGKGNKFDLYGALRCGLTHSIAPKFPITLSSKLEMKNLVEHQGRINLRVEDFYDDFREGCEFVINKTFPLGDKVESAFLSVPNDKFAATPEKSDDQLNNLLSQNDNKVTPVTGSTLAQPNNLNN